LIMELDLDTIGLEVDMIMELDLDPIGLEVVMIMEAQDMAAMIMV